MVKFNVFWIRWLNSIYLEPVDSTFTLPMNPIPDLGILRPQVATKNKNWPYNHQQLQIIGSNEFKSVVLSFKSIKIL